MTNFSLSFYKVKVQNDKFKVLIIILVELYITWIPFWSSPTTTFGYVTETKQHKKKTNEKKGVLKASNFGFRSLQVFLLVWENMDLLLDFWKKGKRFLISQKLLQFFSSIHVRQSFFCMKPTLRKSKVDDSYTFLTFFDMRTKGISLSVHAPNQKKAPILILFIFCLSTYSNQVHFFSPS